MLFLPPTDSQPNASEFLKSKTLQEIVGQAPSLRRPRPPRQVAAMLLCWVSQSWPQAGFFSQAPRFPKQPDTVEP